MNLYVIYHCNEWQEYSSFRLIGVVEEGELHNALELIKQELKYTDEEMNNYIYVDNKILNELEV